MDATLIPYLAAHLKAMDARGGLSKQLARKLGLALISIENIVALADVEHPSLDHMKDWTAYLSAKVGDVRELLVEMADEQELARLEQLIVKSKSTR